MFFTFLYQTQGQLAENLNILTKEQWIKPHYNLDEDIEENKSSEKKIGTTKNKREYETAVKNNINLKLISINP